MAVILHKLDQLDVSRVRVIPFCGKRGRFKYEILVKTGWSRGSGKEAGDWVGTWSLLWSRSSSLNPEPCLMIMEMGITKQVLSTSNVNKDIAWR